MRSGCTASYPGCTKWADGNAPAVDRSRPVPRPVTFPPFAAQKVYVDPMKCEELLAVLNEYVDGTVDPAICEEFEKHLAGCNPCQVVVDNIRKTITLYKDGKPYDLPVEFRQRLHDVLRNRFKQVHPPRGSQS
jgi:hypothetical protein